MLKLALCATLVFCSFAAFSETAKKGEPLPNITATDENGAQIPLNIYKGKSGLVIFFFPKAFTGGCVCENAGFRDYITKYNDKGYTILGASRDEPATLVKFKQIYKLNYTLLSDPNDELAKALGLNGGKRDTIVVDKDGIIQDKKHDVDAPTHHKTLINELK